MNECWFDRPLYHQDQDSTHSTTDASVSSASPVTVVSDGTNTNKPTDKPKRSLSAYNYFFQAQRQEILQTMPTRAEGKPRRSHGKIGFADLARLIAGRWKSISREKRAFYEGLAAEDKARYVKEMDEWKKNLNNSMTTSFASTRTVSANKLQDFVPHKKSSTSSDSAQRRSIPDMVLMTDVSSSSTMEDEDFFSMLDKPLPLEKSMTALSCPTQSIADLADKLDAESLDLLVNIFR